MIRQMIFVATMSLSSFTAHAYPTVKYGEFVIQYALLWLPEYLRDLDNSNEPFLREMDAIARDVRVRSIDESWIPKGEYNETHHSWKRNTLVSFLPESSGQFVIKGTPTNRVAVTGDAIDSKIIFNLDKISDRKTFTYEDALVFWVHEIGHKYIAQHQLGGDKKREAQARIDHLASGIGKRFSRHVVVESGPLIAFNGAPYGSWRHNVSLLYGLMKSREPNKLFYVEGDNLTDLTPVFNRELDRWAVNSWSTMRNSYQVRRHIREMEIWKSEPGEVRARVRFYANRHLLHDDKSYSEHDMGIHYPHMADILIRDGNMRIWHSNRDRADMRRAEDAELDLPYFKVNSDGTFVAEMHLTVSTIRFHHSPTYPVNRKAKLMFVVNGEVNEVPVTTYANLKNNVWGRFPGEIYKTPSLKTARLEGKMPAGWRDGFEIIGLIDDFFELGTYNGQNPFFVAMKRPLRGSGCEIELKKNPDIELTPYIRGYERPGR